MKNRYGKACSRCRKWVEAGQGYLIGRNEVRHDRCPITAEPLGEYDLIRLHAALETLTAMEMPLKAHGGSALFDEALGRVIRTLGEIVEAKT